MSRDTTRLAAYCALCMSGIALGFSLTIAGCRSQDAARGEPVDPGAATAPAHTAKQAPISPAAGEGKATPLGVERGRAHAKAVAEAPGGRSAPSPAPAKDGARPPNQRSAKLEPAPDEFEAAEGGSLAAAELSLKRLVVTDGIDGREPATVSGDLKANDEPIYAFVELANQGAEEGSVVITFEHGSGKSVGHISLSVPAKQKRWRTWGRTRNIDRNGEWVAVVKTADGRELGRRTFAVGS